MSKVTAEQRKEGWTGLERRSVESEEIHQSDENGQAEGETDDHPNLHMRWTWSELPR